MEGVIAPDATLNAKEGGSMMPVLALGLPGSLSTAVLLSAFLLHGVTPGQRMFDEHMPLVWTMILAMALVNVVTSAIGLVVANQLIKVTLVPVRSLAPIVLVLVLLGSYVDRQSFFSILVALGFGLIGIVMTRHDYSRAALLVGMILFPLAEDNFHLSLRISRGSYDFLLRPITLSVLVILGVALALPYLWRRWVRPRVRVRAGGDAAAPSEAPIPVGEPEPINPVSDTVVAFSVVVVGVVMVVLSFGYSPTARFFPLLVLGVVIALAVWLTGRGLGRLTRRPRPRRPEPDTAEPKSADSQDNPGAGRPAATSAVTALAWIIALPALIWLLGAVPGIFVYTAVFMLGFRPRRPRPAAVVTSLVIATILAGVAGYGFQYMLGIQLPQGELVHLSY